MLPDAQPNRKNCFLPLCNWESNADAWIELSENLERLPNHMPSSPFQVLHEEALFLSFFMEHLAHSFQFDTFRGNGNFKKSDYLNISIAWD
jgi:hypothetical protein